MEPGTREAPSQEYGVEQCNNAAIERLKADLDVLERELKITAAGTNPEAWTRAVRLARASGDKKAEATEIGNYTQRLKDTESEIMEKEREIEIIKRAIARLSGK